MISEYFYLFRITKILSLIHSYIALSKMAEGLF